MNLYIKNLEPHITNNDLTQIFRKFGRIISARVMTNPQTGQSKGYGFVSFGKTEEAAAALHEMHGAMLGNRPLVVAYHEPRKPRSTTTNYQDSYYNHPRTSKYYIYLHKDYCINTK
jgi:RNA recognition motif-containing protein